MRALLLQSSLLLLWPQLPAAAVGGAALKSLAHPPAHTAVEEVTDGRAVLLISVVVRRERILNLLQELPLRPGVLKDRVPRAVLASHDPGIEHPRPTKMSGPRANIGTLRQGSPMIDCRSVQ